MRTAIFLAKSRAVGQSFPACRDRRQPGGKLSAKDIFDNNAFANDARTQFMNWGLTANEAWMFSDVDHTASLGLSLNGGLWRRANDTFGVAGILNGISQVHRRFLSAGGTGILAGDGKLNYGLEQIMETYYDFQIWKTVHGAFDYQFINHPAFNRDRGPVSVLSARLHWSF